LVGANAVATVAVGDDGRLAKLRQVIAATTSLCPRRIWRILLPLHRVPPDRQQSLHFRIPRIRIKGGMDGGVREVHVPGCARLCEQRQHAVALAEVRREHRTRRGADMRKAVDARSFGRARRRRRSPWTASTQARPIRASMASNRPR